MMAPPQDHEVEEGNCYECSTVCGVGVRNLPIDLTDADQCKCYLCGGDAAAETPLSSMSTIVKYGKTRPWAKYRVIKEGKVAVKRKPTGNYCMICRNVYNTLGLEEVHKSMPDFYSYISKTENAHVGRHFVTCQVMWVKKHNQDEDAVRLKGARELKDVFTKLLTKHVEESGFDCPDWDFISKEAWDPKIDGPWDASKMTTQVIFGVNKEGVWVRKGREGVFHWKHSEKDQQEQVTEEDDGKGLFAEDRLKNKLDVTRKAQQAFEKQRNQKCVDNSDRLGVDQVMALLQGVSLDSTQSGEGASGEVPPSGEADKSCDDDDDEPPESDEDEMPQKVRRGRLASLFQTSPIATAPLAKAKAAASRAWTSPAKAVPDSTHPPTLMLHRTFGNRQNLNSGSPASGPVLIPQKREHATPTAPTVLLDGRTKRIRESLQASVTHIDMELKGIKFEEFLEVQGDKKKKMDLQDTTIAHNLPA